MHIGLVALVVLSLFAIAALAYFQICRLFFHPAIVVLSLSHLVILTLFTLAALQCVCHAFIFT